MNITKGGWIPYRGDYGARYSLDLIPLVEAANCSKGCTKSGTDAERDEFGPGGNCHILAMVSIGDQETPIPELVPTVDGIACTARQDPATVGIEPLVDVEPVPPKPIGPDETPNVDVESDWPDLLSLIVGAYVEAGAEVTG